MEGVDLFNLTSRKPMKYTTIILEDEGEIIFNIQSPITFRDHDEFFKIVDTIKKSTCKNVAINLEECEFVDSAGLGMLVILSDETNAKGMKATILKPRGRVKDVLYAARFENLFNIEG